MASYVNLILDTTAPKGVKVLINGDEKKTASTAVTLTISCSDEDKTDYQMKIWGISGVTTESSASWEDYCEQKNVTLPTGDGAKTVYIKIRDDVWNESETVSDVINLYTSVPMVKGFTADKSKLSLVEGKNSIIITGEVSEDVDAMKIVIVDDINAEYNSPSNKSIPITNGSALFQYPALGGIANMCVVDYLEFENLEFDHSSTLSCTITGKDFQSAAGSDGLKIVKVFVRSATSGKWSV